MKYYKNFYNLYVNDFCVVFFFLLGIGEMVFLLFKYLLEISF